MARKRIPSSGEEAGLNNDRFFEESGFRIRDYQGGPGDTLPDDAQPDENRSYQFIIHSGDRYYTTTLTANISTGWGAVGAMLSEYELDLDDVDEWDIRVFDDMSET